MGHHFRRRTAGISGGFTPQEFRFGDFTLNPSTYRLQRDSRSLRLEKLPMELLILLVQRRGELVSREEIAGRLWGKDVFLDVDHSINTAVRKIRTALRDDSEKPRFVETVVGKGYRFAAPVICSNGDTNPHLQPPPPTGVLSGPAVPSTRKRVLPVRVWVLLTGVAVLLLGATLWLQRSDYFWRNVIAHARFQTVTDFDGVEQAAAVSRDGQFVTFLSDQDGHMDVWVTQVGSGQFHNLTNGTHPELVNPSIRTLGFSPDGSLVTFWVRNKDASSEGDISTWAVPTLGGQPKPYLEDAAEFDWSHDGSRLAYHTPGPGDPLFVLDGSPQAKPRRIFAAPAGIHAHFPLWSPDNAFIYFVQGSLPDQLDIWRIAPSGGTPERITSHNGRVTYPVLLDRRTLLYLASDPDGSGPWLYGLDVERRIPHRLTSGPDRYTSLAASADGRRLVATLASPKKSLWRSQIADSTTEVSPAAQIPFTTSTGFSPRLGPNYLLYVAATSTSESIWKLIDGAAAELWSGQGAQVFGGPAISPDGLHVAFSVRQHGQTFLYLMQADGTNARILTNSLDLHGDPAWAPDGQSITSAAEEHGVPHLIRIPVDGRSPYVFDREYSLAPAWAPDGNFYVYT
jgi:Tol biopolymer transport system component/DNA-binding winged helix-turn-helix (wHTH) protein